jgi:hypothetical protein
MALLSTVLVVLVLPAVPAARPRADTGLTITAASFGGFSPVVEMRSAALALGPSAAPGPLLTPPVATARPARTPAVLPLPTSLLGAPGAAAPVATLAVSRVVVSGPLPWRSFTPVEERWRPD